MTIETGLPANDSCCADVLEQAISKRQRKANSAYIPRLSCHRQRRDDCEPAAPPVQYSILTEHCETPQIQEVRMDKIAFPYRSSSHLVLLHVVAESGAWEKHGLQVDYDRHISSGEAHRAVPTGEVEFVGGNHVSTYAHRARGDSWVYLGQTVNQVNHQLVVRPDSGINGLADLQGRKVGPRGSPPSLNDWLYLKQHGLDSDRDDIEFVNQTKLKQGSMDAEDLA